MMHSNKALRRLIDLPKFGTGLGMRRTAALLEAVAPSPPPAIGITGSKGKGSVTAMTESLLRSQGLSTVRHTSPHFLSPEERIAINGKALAADRFNDVISRVLDSAESVARKYGQQFSRFEILFAAAVSLATEEKVDCAVLEVGIGGRFDPTGLTSPDPIAVTGIELEHTEILGSTEELIALDKLDLAGPGATAILGPLKDDLIGQMEVHAKRRGIHLVRASTLFPLVDYQEDNDGSVAVLREATGRVHSLRLPLGGEFQASNAVTSLALSSTALKRLRPPRENDWISAADRCWRDLRWPGRLEVIARDPDVVADAGHTPEALGIVIQSIKNWRHSPRVLLIGVSENKDWKQIAVILTKLDAPAVVSSSGHLGVDPRQLATAFVEAGGRVIGVKPDLAEAVALARTKASNLGGTVYVLGGLFFAADVTRTLLGLNPADAIYL